MTQCFKCLFVSITLPFLFASCKAQTKQTTSDIDPIFQVFFKWKNDVLVNGSFVEVCPTVDEFEEIQDSSKYKQLSEANLFPKEYNVSFGYFNNDHKIDALFSFQNTICYGNAIGAIPPWLYNRPNYFVLITSNYEGYRISSNLIDVDKITTAIQKEVKASSVSISFEKIEGNGILSGTCKIWPDEKDENFEGLCCPSTLVFFQVDNNNRKISLFINDTSQEDYSLNF